MSSSFWADATASLNSCFKLLASTVFCFWRCQHTTMRSQNWHIPSSNTDKSSAKILFLVLFCEIVFLQTALEIYFLLMHLSVVSVWVRGWQPNEWQIFSNVSNLTYLCFLESKLRGTYGIFQGISQGQIDCMKFCYARMIFIRDVLLNKKLGKKLLPIWQSALPIWVKP